MKRILISLFVYLFFLGFQSCGIDNYEAPSASFSGTLIDMDNGSMVPCQALNGAKLRMYEFYEGKWATQPNDTWVNQEGVFVNNTVFPGLYKIILDGPFEAMDTIEVEIKGAKKMDIEVLPFMRLSISTELSNKSVKVNTELQVLSKNRDVTALEFYCAKTPYLDKNTFYKKEVVDLGSELLPSYSFTFDDLEGGKKYYFRVGALADNSSGFYNYSKVVEVMIP